MIHIRIKIVSDKKDVQAFLEELKEILEDKEFNIDKNLSLIMKRKERVQFSTSYTMITLNYNIYDVVESLKELTVKEYSETLIDKEDNNPPLLFVFGKDINNKQIYIKLKIKGTINKKVLCLSFHYAEWDMDFPYAK